jgi:hypothetical protein
MLTSRFAALIVLSLPPALAQPVQNSTDRGFGDRALDLVRPAKPTPLTPQERFKLYVLDTVGPVPLLGAAAGAGIEQWADRPAEWRQGWGRMRQAIRQQPGL